MRLFVANRGEIARRIIQAAHALGLETVLGASEADRDSLAARDAGRMIVLGPAASRHSYLDPRLVVHAAMATGCNALHPGYGFLSERPDLADLCAHEGVTFIGPSADSIRVVGDKLSARTLAGRVGVPLTRASGSLRDLAAALREATSLGYPVLTKASAGGGGRGMIVVRTPAELPDAFAHASATAREAFGDDTLYLEAYVEHARHIEVQVVGDGMGGVVHFGERDCSIQRRYQKMIEEAPAAILDQVTRNRMRRAAVDLLGSIGYRNAGTVEFLYDEDRREFSFMEVNARIQVEHPVSEEITGVDLVRLQLEIGMAGRPLPPQEEISLRGHAIEARILAEDSTNGFLPSPGRITNWQPPLGPGIRVDTGFAAGSNVPPYYDSMIAKLIVLGDSRHMAIDRLSDALARFEIGGIRTNIPLLRAIVAHDDFRANRLSTRWLETTFLPSLSHSKE